MRVTLAQTVGVFIGWGTKFDFFSYFIFGALTVKND
jgi:hypothetical protein